MLDEDALDVGELRAQPLGRTVDRCARSAHLGKDAEAATDALLNAVQADETNFARMQPLREEGHGPPRDHGDRSVAASQPFQDAAGPADGARFGGVGHDRRERAVEVAEDPRARGHRAERAHIVVHGGRHGHSWRATRR